MKVNGIKKLKSKNIIIFSLALIVVLTVFIYSIHNLTKDRNMGFDSQELFIGSGYKESVDIASGKLDDYTEYLDENQERIDGYDVDVASVIVEVEQGDYTNVGLLNGVEVDDSDMYKQDVQALINQEYLKLSLDAYELYRDGVGEGRAELYSKLENLERLHDAVSYDIDIEETKISATAGMSLINDNLALWGHEIYRGQVNVVLEIYTLIAIVLIIYRFIKDKETGLLVLFSLVLLSSVFVYRKIEDNYYPPYMQINNMLGVNTNTEGKYFINFIPIMVADTFESNGGNFNVMNVDGELKEVDWSNSDDIENWLNAPYGEGESVSNVIRLENIKDSMEEPLTGPEKNYPGDFGIGGWNFTGDNKS